MFEHTFIDVGHNSDSLSCAKHVYVRNLAAAKHVIRKVMDAKRPKGMRLRHNYDYPSSSVYLEAHSMQPIETVLHALRATHNVVGIDNKRLKLS